MRSSTPVASVLTSPEIARTLSADMPTRRNTLGVAFSLAALPHTCPPSRVSRSRVASRSNARIPSSMTRTRSRGHAPLLFRLALSSQRAHGGFGSAGAAWGWGWSGMVRAAPRARRRRAPPRARARPPSPCEQPAAARTRPCAPRSRRPPASRRRRRARCTAPAPPAKTNTCSYCYQLPNHSCERPLHFNQGGGSMSKPGGPAGPCQIGVK
eukprot:7391519-Prymnesium_polylepis.1